MDHRILDIPMGLGVHLWATNGEPLADPTHNCHLIEPLADPTHYCHLVGILVYIGITGHDFSHPFYILSQFVSLLPPSSTTLTFVAFFDILHGTMSCRLHFPHSSPFQLQAYSDATWASDHSNHNSLSAYFVLDPS